MRLLYFICMRYYIAVLSAHHLYRSYLLMHPYICFSIPSMICQSRRINFSRLWLAVDYRRCTTIRERRSAGICLSVSTGWFAESKNLTTNYYLKCYFYRRVLNKRGSLYIFSNVHFSEVATTLEPPHLPFLSGRPLEGLHCPYPEHLCPSKQSWSSEGVERLSSPALVFLYCSIAWRSSSCNMITCISARYSVLYEKWLNESELKRTCLIKYPIFDVKVVKERSFLLQDTG